MEFINRLIAPTPPFFQKVRNIGMFLTAIAAAIFGLPGELPQVVIEIAAVTAIIGSVMAGLGQSAVKDE